MNLIFHTLSTPSAGDPEGMQPVESGGDGVASTLPATFVSFERGSYTVDITCCSGTVSRRSGVTEGTGPGQVTARARAPRATIAAAKQAVAALEKSDPSPVVRRIVGALKRSYSGESAAKDLAGLAQLIPTLPSATDRALAVLTFAYLLRNDEP